jgi:hypothetical protein
MSAKTCPRCGSDRCIWVGDAKGTYEECLCVACGGSRARGRLSGIASLLGPDHPKYEVIRKLTDGRPPGLS